MFPDTVHQVELRPLSESSWRVIDRISSDEEGMLIAYVERIPPGLYEVVWVYDGSGVSEFTTLEDVLVAAAQRLSSHVAPGTKPVPIPHRAPLARH
jgi:hypothetical protein